MIRTTIAAALALLLVGPAAAADEPPADARAADAWKLVESGQPNRAILIFRSILDADPTRLDAHDGLVRAHLAVGDPEAAARAADARLAQRPDDEAFERWRLYVLGLAPSRRDEAIAGYRALVEARPDDAESWRNLALFLSWSPGRLPESVEAWRRAVAVDEKHAGARLGLARTLAWSGINDEAAALFDALLAEDPKNVEALLGRAQLARWTGDRRTARALIERAEALAPEHPRVRAERSRLELDAGRRGVARGAARSALELSPGLYEGEEALDAIADATAPSVAARFTVTDETTGFRRFGVAVPGELYPLPDTRLRIEAGFTRFSVDPRVAAPNADLLLPGRVELDRVSLGAEVEQTGLPQGLYARGAYRLHALLDFAPTHEVDLEVGTARPLDLPVELRVGVRQRALVDLPADDRVVAPLNAVGSGGGTLAAVEERVQVREGYAGLVVAPWSGFYVYGDGALGDIDGNTRRAVSAGLGQDVLRLLAPRSAHALTVRYDLYHLDVATPDPRFFSPDAFFAHTPGAEWRWSPGSKLTLGVEAGVPLRADSPPGWLAGAFAGVGLGDHVRLDARIRATDDTAWRAIGGTLGVSGRW